MKNALNIFVCGANGKMGKQIINLVLSDPELCLVGASERSDCPVLGADAGLNAGSRQASVSITTDLKRAMDKYQGVIVDFSSVESALENLRRASEFGLPVVLGTTGFTPEQAHVVQQAAAKIPLLFTPNMSVAMNVMFRLVDQAARALKDDFDIEILEMHHKHKVDAPSGTAMKLAHIACESSGKVYPDSLKFDRHGEAGARSAGEIGMQVVRGGDIVGDHTVFYCGTGERLEIRHVASDRTTFALGAIRAAKWLQGKPAGSYEMKDVLGIG
jgi:4-hydroxy-tetrahydrodipicolinate reductase